MTASHATFRLPRPLGHQRFILVGDFRLADPRVFEVAAQDERFVTKAQRNQRREALQEFMRRAGRA